MANDVLNGDVNPRKQRTSLATSIAVANWLRSGGPKRHGCGRSLWLQITPTNTASWLLRHTHDGKPRSFGLGRCDLSGKAGLTLKQARERADDALARLREGIDPSTKRQAALAKRKADAEAKAVAAVPKPAETTFKMVAHDLIEARAEGWRNRKSEMQWWSSLVVYVFPTIGDRAPADVTVDDVLAILKQPVEGRDGKTGPFWSTLPETASRVRGRIETVLSASKARKLRQGENVAAWDDNLSLLLAAKNKIAKVRHHPALAWQRVPELMTILAGKSGQAARALRLLILCASRSGEVRLAVRFEFDLANRTWVIPGGRMKGGKQHAVPLSEPAVALLTEMFAEIEPGPDALIFPSQRGTPLSDMTLTQTLRRLDLKDQHGDVIVAHGFRSSFRDWCGETGQPTDIAEQALAHAAGGKVERAYARSDLFARRVALMRQWGEHCCPGDAAANVVPFARGAAG